MLETRIVTFQDAVDHLKAGEYIILRDRPGGRLLIKSEQKAWKKMGAADFLSKEWEVYEPDDDDDPEPDDEITQEVYDPDAP